MELLIKFAEFVVSLGVVVITCVTVTKAETGGGGSMGLGNLGGRASNTPVGQDRILKPLMLWCGVTFIYTSILMALPKENMGKAALTVPLFVLGMWFRQQIGERLGQWLGLSED